KLHYHERTDEFYYVIAGQGTMTLDGEEIELHPGGRRLHPARGPPQGPGGLDRPHRLHPARRPRRRARAGMTTGQGSWASASGAETRAVAGGPRAVERPAGWQTPRKGIAPRHPAAFAFDPLNLRPM